MPRGTLILAAVAASVIAGAIGAGVRAQGVPGKAPAPCTLLTADDVATVLGGRVTPVSTAGTPAASTSCIYNGAGGLGVQLMLWGSRAEFDRLIGQLPASTLSPVSGLGDKAFENIHTGSGAEVYVAKGGTAFQIVVGNGSGVASLNDPTAKSAVALARKAADRIK